MAVPAEVAGSDHARPALAAHRAARLLSAVPTTATRRTRTKRATRRPAFARLRCTPDPRAPNLRVIVGLLDTGRTS
jgi:hypothetical protein